MSLKTKLVLSHLGTSVTFSLQNIWDNPIQFVAKVSRRLNMSELASVLHRKFSKSPHYKQIQNLLIERGERNFIRRLRERSRREVRRFDSWATSDELNILYLVNNATPYTKSGYTVRTDELLRALRYKLDASFRATRLGYPSVIGTIPCNKPSDLVLNIPFIFPYSEPRRFELMVSKVVNFCRTTNITVIHATSDFENAHVAAEAAYRLGIPWVYEIRGEPYNTWLSGLSESDRLEAKYSSLYQDWASQEHRCASAAMGVVALSELKRRALEANGVDPKKILVVPNSIDERYLGFQTETPAVRLQSVTKSVGCITSLVEYEGIDDLIRAMAYLPENVELLIVGSGEDEDRLRSLRDSVHYRDRIRFLGYQPPSEMPRWYSSLDAFVIPRKNREVTRNVTPIKPLPALALGIPIVASDLPALREVTGGYARFTTPEEPMDIASGIIDVLANGKSYVAPKDWVKLRTWASQSKRLINLYETILFKGAQA